MSKVTNKEQLQVIKETKWTKDHAALLAQARIFQDNETQRLKTTTLKVQIYLGVLIAIPAATATVLRLGGKNMWQDLSLPGFLLSVILSIGAFYWMRAMWHGQQALSVGTYHFMDVGDFKEAAESSKPSATLIAKILEITVLNQSMHNKKITSLRGMESSIFKLVVTLSIGIVGALGFALWPYILAGYKFIECNCS